MSEMERTDGCDRVVARAGGIKVLDLFAGCGALSHGFLQAGGFKIMGACQWEADRPWIARTFQRNHFGTELVDADITLPETKDRICGIFKDSHCDVVIGGPPCVAYSMAGRRDPNDPRGRLFEDYLAIVGVLRPPVIVMENVVGILSRRKGEDEPPIRRIVAGLVGLGYRVEFRVLNAADFGVPQCRRRVIIIGTRLDVPIRFPMPTHAEQPDFFGEALPWVTVRDALADLVDAPEDRNFWHVFVRSSPGFLDRIRRTPPGKSASIGYHEVFQRLSADRPSITVKGANGGVPIHYSLDRLITPREMARLQGFPDSFQFLGAKGDVLLMIGNAVPVGLAQAVACGVKEMLG